MCVALNGVRDDLQLPLYQIIYYDCLILYRYIEKLSIRLQCRRGFCLVSKIYAGSELIVKVNS